MVGFYLKNTVTENGYVSRGVCETAGGMLRGITERTRIEKKKDGIAYSEDEGQTWVPLSPDAVVSMNLWGFTPGFTSALEEDSPALLPRRCAEKSGKSGVLPALCGQ